MIRVGTPLTAVPDIPVWLESFSNWAEAGLHEIPGKKSNTTIGEMLALVGQASDDHIPWCSAAMNAAMLESGLKGTGKAYARSWEHWGRRLAKPRLGCVAVLWRDSPVSGKGHVSCWLGEHAGSLVLFGGNQGNRVAISYYPAGRVVGYYWPDETCLIGAK